MQEDKVTVVVKPRKPMEVTRRLTLRTTNLILVKPNRTLTSIPTLAHSHTTRPDICPIYIFTRPIYIFSFNVTRLKGMQEETRGNNAKKKRKK
eukprot:898444-Amorphochlora_amoeboformis.AAC.1